MNLNIERTKNIGRILIGSLFLISAIHSLFFEFHEFAKLIELKHIPFPFIIAFIVLIFKLVSGILIISNNYENYILTLLIIFVLMATILYHNIFVNMTQFNNMIKNIAIIGGLMLLYK